MDGNSVLNYVNKLHTLYFSLVFLSSIRGQHSVHVTGCSCYVTRIKNAWCGVDVPDLEAR